MNYIHWLFLLIVITSCSSGDKQKSLPVSNTFPISIPFEEGVNNVKGIKLSDIAERVEWVPLETTDSSLVAQVRERYIILSNGRIFIPCSIGVLSFSEKGKFLKSIARKGQGPGEYAAIRTIFLDEFSRSLYIFDNGKMLVYTAEGAFLHESHHVPISAWDLSVMKDSIVLAYFYNNTGQKKYRMIAMNMKGDTVMTLLQPDRFEVMPKGMNWYYTAPTDKYLYAFQDVNVFHDYYCDTLYTVTTNGISPRYILQTGKYRLPDDLRLEAVMMTSDRNQALARAEKYFRPTVFETDRYVVMPYTTWNIIDPQKADPQLMLYDKQTGLCTRAQGGAIQNDMAGDLPFYPVARIADNVLMASIEAEELLEKAKEGVELPESLKGLKEDDNPVLILVYLKK